MTTPNTTGPSAEIQRYYMRSKHRDGKWDIQEVPFENGLWVKFFDVEAALSRAREEARREALEEADQLRARVACLQIALGDMLSIVRSEPTMDGSERPMGLVDYRRAASVLREVRRILFATPEADDAPTPQGETKEKS